MKNSHHYGMIDPSKIPSSPFDDRIHHHNFGGRKERAAQFGLGDEDMCMDESFECNQSFPRALQPQSKFKQNEFNGDITHIRGIYFFLVLYDF
jgi:hypothetical protein